MHRGNCGICGQKLTDASGEWTVLATPHCINEWRKERLKCCSYCKSKIDDFIMKMMKKPEDKA